MLAILAVVMLIGVTIITVRTVSAWLAGQVLIVLPSYTMPRTPPVFIPAAGTLAPILEKKSLKSFPGDNIDLRLLYNQGFLWQCQARLLVMKILQRQVKSLYGFDE